MKELAMVCQPDLDQHIESLCPKAGRLVVPLPVRVVVEREVLGSSPWLFLEVLGSSPCLFVEYSEVLGSSDQGQACLH